MTNARPVLAASAVVLDDAGRVLCVLRGKPPHAGEWSLPGGRTREGESPLETAVREVFEETGVVVRATGEIACVRVAREGFEYDLRVVRCALDPGHTSAELTARDDARDARWFDVRDLPGLGASRDVLEAVERAVGRIENR